MENLVIWQVTCLECSDHRYWYRSEISEFGMDGKPLRFFQLFMPNHIWLWYFFLEGKTLFNRETSAITASSVDSKECFFLFVVIICYRALLNRIFVEIWEFPVSFITFLRFRTELLSTIGHTRGKKLLLICSWAAISGSDMAFIKKPYEGPTGPLCCAWADWSI